MQKLVLAASAFLLLSGCAIAPSVNVLGAYFPAWLFCISAGVLLTVIVHIIRTKKDIWHWLAPVELSYLLLTTLFSIGVWLLFFE